MAAGDGASEDHPLLVFLFSNPLVADAPDRRPGAKRIIPSSQMDADVELRALHSWLQSSEKQVRLRKVVATVKHLEEATRTPVRAIHFLGHGTRMGSLVLEDDSGKAKPTKSEALAGLLGGSPPRALPSQGEHGERAASVTAPDGPSLVFAAACDSKQAATAFAAAGVPHVVGTTSRVADKTVRDFAAVFYGCLIKDGMTVAAAFERARRATAMQLDRGTAPFVLLGRGTDPTVESAFVPDRLDVHDVSVFGDALPGAWVDETPPPPPSCFPRPPAVMLGRSVVAQRAFALARATPCVCLQAQDGKRGLGLSALASWLCRYAHRRRFPESGVVMVTVRRRPQPAALGDEPEAGPAAGGAEAAAAGPAGEGGEPWGLPEAASPPSMWRRVWRSVRRAAGRARLMQGESEPTSERALLSLLRRRMRGLLLVIDGLDALEPASPPASLRGASAPLADGDGGGGARRPARRSPEEDDDEEDDEPDGRSPAGSPSRRVSPLAAAGRGFAGGRGMPSTPLRSGSALAAVPVAGPRPAAIDESKQDEEGGADAPSPLTPARARVQSVPSGAGRQWSGALHGHSQSTGAMRAPSTGSEGGHIGRAASVPARRSPSGHHAPGSAGEARKFITRLLAAVDGARVVYTTCSRPLAPQLSAGSEAVVSVPPLSELAAGSLVLRGLPGAHDVVGDLGVSFQQYSDCGRSWGLSVGRYLPAVTACGGRPAVLLRLARALAQVGGGVLGNALRSLTPAQQTKLVKAAQDLDVPLPDALDAAGLGIAVPPTLGGAGSYASDTEADGHGDTASALRSGWSSGLGATGSAGGDPMFGPTDEPDAADDPAMRGLFPPPARAASSSASAGPSLPETASERSQSETLRSAFGTPAHMGLAEALASGHMAPAPAPAASAAAGEAGASASAASGASPGSVPATRAGWTLDGLLAAADGVFGRGMHSLDRRGASLWLEMRLGSGGGEADESAASRPCPFDFALWALRSQLDQTAPRGLASRDLCEGDALLVESVLTRAGQPLGASRRVTFTQWCSALWPWIRDAAGILESADALWAQRAPAPLLHPFLDSDSAAAMLDAACRDGVAGAFVVRLSAQLPCAVAVSYTAHGPAGVGVCKVQLTHHAGMWILPAANGSVYRCPTLARLIGEVESWEWLVNLTQEQGFVGGAEPAMAYRLVDKAEALAALHRPQAAASQGYTKVA